RRRAAPPTPLLPQVFYLAGVVWLVGAGLWFLMTAWRVRGFHRLLRHARPAPESLQNEARRHAEEMGLRWGPRVYLLPRQLPPLLWALGTPRLFFPQALLPKLDDTGRLALLLHELAHVARLYH